MLDTLGFGGIVWRPIWASVANGAALNKFLADLMS